MPIESSTTTCVLDDARSFSFMFWICLQGAFPFLACSCFEKQHTRLKQTVRPPPSPAYGIVVPCHSEALLKLCDFDEMEIVVQRKVDSPSKYPVRSFSHQQEMLMILWFGFISLLLSHINRLSPQYGIVWYGNIATKSMQAANKVLLCTYCIVCIFKQE